MKVSVLSIVLLTVCGILYSIMLITMKNEKWQEEIKYYEMPIVIKQQSIISTPACFIPMMDAFGAMVKPYIHINKHYDCPNPKFITFRDGYSVKINRTTVSKYYNSTFKHCSYVPFTKAGSSDKEYTILWKQRQNFTDRIHANHPFVIVFCYFKNDSLIEKQVYAFIIRDKTSDKIMEGRYKRSENEHLPMNVLFFLFESTSRLNFIRHMNWTYSYLINNMEAVELYGYNKVGLNTFPNIVPVLLGISVPEMNYTGDYLDKYPFIWKTFSQAGYRTFYIEDGSSSAAFNYLKEGFARPPVDHYMRTYILAKETEKEIYHYDLCMENKLGVEVMMDSTKEFIEVYKDVPHFSITILSCPTHDDPSGLGIEDIPYLKMLKSLQKDGSLANSVLIFLGDHGSRYGDIRNTFQGRLEENLPALYIVLPEWFRKKYQHFYSNLKLNARKLTNNYDIHATLMDIINIGKGNLDYGYKGKYGKSLFRFIPNNRTCKDIRTPPVYCACSTYQDISVDNNMVKMAVNYAIQKLNGMLFIHKDVCAQLYLKKIATAQKSVVSKTFLQGESNKIVSYVVTFEVLPSSALFEAIVEYNFDSRDKKLLGDISRLNKYGAQSYCIHDRAGATELERYCFCKKQIK